MHPGLFVQRRGGDWRIEEHLSINSGAVVNSDESQNWHCCLALEDWRSATKAELACLVSSREVHLPDAVTVLALPPSVRGQFWDQVGPHIRDASFGVSPDERRDVLWSFANKVAKVLTEESQIEVLSLRSCDVQITPTKSRSTGFDYHHKRFVGLHIDDHDQLAMDARREGFLLFCLNVGMAERYLQFVNLPVPALRTKVVAAIEEVGLEVDTIQNLPSRFFRTWPNYPVVRLTLPPNHAYIAVTQYLIHDGATNTIGQPDVAFLLAGQFRLRI